MTTATLHPLAAQYLKRLRRSARRLSHARRRELLADIEAHLRDAVAPSAADSEARAALDRLGDPDEIIDSEWHDGDGPGRRRGAHEWAAIVLLLFGGFIAGVGWLVGVALLWSSHAWTMSEKLIGTLVIPGGLGLWAVWVTVIHHIIWNGASASPSLLLQVVFYALLLVLVIAPVVTMVFLARRARGAVA
jgi:hypothetical protein